MSSLSEQLEDREQRHLHVEAQIRIGVPLQIRAMRESRGWTQSVMAEKLGTTQNAISRLENPGSGKPNIGTLERIAEVCDVALLVRFVPFSHFVRTVDGMSNSSVAIPDYQTEKAQEEQLAVVQKQLSALTSADFTSRAVFPRVVRCAPIRDTGDRRSILTVAHNQTGRLESIRKPPMREVQYQMVQVTQGGTRG